MTATDQLLGNNAEYAESFEHQGISAAPVLKIAVVTCMDARLDPARALGIGVGEAHIIRNAGGVVTDDVIRSLSISQNQLGTEEIVILHHSDCGLLTFTDEEFAAASERRTGERPAWAAMTFTDVDEDVRESVRRVRADPFIPRTGNVRGFVYEVETGRVREVS